MKEFYSKILLLFIAVSCAASLSAQSGQTFSVATLNVDGRPPSVLFITVNPDGPKEEYTPVIGRYLAQRSFDFISTQENFNYNDELSAELRDDYNQDEYSGGIFTSGSWLNIWDLRFPCDGLSGFYRKQHQLTEMQRTTWDTCYGLTDHDNDALASKGFRRYELTLDCGVDIRLYNLHMDASADDDVLNGDDGPDAEARVQQLQQLRQDILKHMDNRPVIILGDYNCYYARDELKTTFIDAIVETTGASVGDAWIELERDGHYPEYTNARIISDSPGWGFQGEVLDKILYINPVNSDIRLRPVSVNIDRTEYMREDGKTALGDHFPLSATFMIESTTGVDALYADDNRIEAIYAIDGRQFPRLQRGLNIVRMSDGTTRKIRY